MAEVSINGLGLDLHNEAGTSKSPYVHGHRDNPVAWQIWGDETLALAKKHNRLIFLSIGYNACHWCHVMERESFTCADIADLLNEHFIPIKLDREERPDIDALYMNYIEATTGTGGWPLNVFLTPDLEPVFGGTYFPGPSSSIAPPNEAGEAVDFADVLKRMRDVWTNQQQRCRESARDAMRQLKDRAQEGVHGLAIASPDELPDLDLFEEALKTMQHSYDEQNGGFNVAPKFPVPQKLQFLLNLGQWPSPVKDIIGQSSLKGVSMALATLRQIARGAVRDHIGFGISRYSVTADWSLPHFEKVLADQALLLDAFLDAFLLTHDSELLSVVYDLATYLTSAPILSKTGGFYSSEDADSAPSRSDPEEREGAFYVWTEKAVKALLGPGKADIVIRFYGLSADGNIPREFDPHDDFMNQNTLSIASTPNIVSKELGISESEVVKVLREARVTLREHRDSNRPRPRLDDKIVVSSNGLAIAALARASAAISAVDHITSEAWLKEAEAAAQFIKQNLYTCEEQGTGTLWRIWRDGRGNSKGLADDYANMIKASIELYAATFNVEWLKWADDLMRAQISKFWADNGGFYTAEQDKNLPLRLKSGMDGSEPSANAQSAINLCRLSSLFDDQGYEKLARRTVAAFEPEIEQFPASFPGLLQAVAWLSGGPRGTILEGSDASKDGRIKLSDALAKLRGQTGVGRTVLRFPDPRDPGEQWLRARRTQGLRTMVYDKSRYKLLKEIKGLS